MQTYNYAFSDMFVCYVFLSYLCSHMSHVLTYVYIMFIHHLLKAHMGQ